MGPSQLGHCGLRSQIGLFGVNELQLRHSGQANRHVLTSEADLKYPDLEHTTEENGRGRFDRVLRASISGFLSKLIKDPVKSATIRSHDRW